MRSIRYWWLCRGGVREVLMVALPMMLSYGLWSIQNLIDRMFLLRDSTETLAAALSPGMLQWTLACLPLGIAGYVNTFVAQYLGAKTPDRIGSIVWQGIWFSLATLPCFLLTGAMAKPLFRAFGHAPDLAAAETLYFQSLAPGMTAIVLNAALASYFTGLGRTLTVLYANLLAAAVNLTLDYALIFGEWGCPKWGIFGAGVATSIANWSACAWLALALALDRDAVKCGMFRHFRLQWRALRRLLEFGLSSGLPMLIESAGISVLVMYIARFQEHSTAATNLAFNINAVAFVPMIGMGIAVASLVGKYAAAGRYLQAERSVWISLAIGLSYQAAFAVIYLSFPEWCLRLHETTGGEDIEQVKRLTIVLLRFVAAYCMFDAMQAILVGALKGAGDTWFVMFVSGGVAIGSIVLGRIGEALFGWQVLGWWGVLTAWIFTLGIVFLIRFLSGVWKTMRVIEPEVTVL